MHGSRGPWWMFSLSYIPTFIYRFSSSLEDINLNVLYGFPEMIGWAMRNNWASNFRRDVSRELETHICRNLSTDKSNGSRHCIQMHHDAIHQKWSILLCVRNFILMRFSGCSNASSEIGQSLTPNLSPPGRTELVPLRNSL